MPADWPAWAGSGEPAARRLQARIRGPSPVCRSVLFGSHSILEKKKISSKLSTFKTRESSPKKIGFPFSNNNNKSKHFCVVYCVWCPSKRLASLCSPDWESSVLGRFCAAGVRLAVSRLLQLGQPRRWPRLLLVVCVPAWQPWPGLEVAWARALHSPQPHPLSVRGYLPCLGPGLGFIGLGLS